MDEAVDLFEQLYSCLKSQEEIIEWLTASGECQFESLRQNSLDELNQTVQEQEEGATRMKKAEHRRLLLQESLVKKLELEQGATLSELLPYTQEPLKSSLKQLHITLQKKVRKLKDINSLNALLITNTLEVNSRILHIMNAGAPRTYGLKGEMINSLKRKSVISESV